MKLYKYRYGSKRDLESLKNNYFYAPHPSELNDPFEGMAIPISLSICGSGSFGSLGLPHPLVEDRMNQYRILSLSANLVNELIIISKLFNVDL